MTVNRESGSAVIVALFAAVLLAALGTGLCLLSLTETQVAVNFRTAGETFYAADAGIALALGSLGTLPRWTDALTGSAVSDFHDVTRRVTLATGEVIDLDAVTTELQAESDAAGVWGPNNPVWQLFAWGQLPQVASSQVDSPAYLAVWVGDDASETDGNPASDSNDCVRLHAEAYASAQSRRIVEVTVARAAGGVRVLAWREVR
jgi:hypothetical protein